MLAVSSAAAGPPVSHEFNDDGLSDYPVTVIGYDEVTPASGAARMWSGASKAIIDTIVPTDTNTLFGWSVASAGDFDGDDFDDLLVGEPLWGSPGPAGVGFEGRVRVFSGADSTELFAVSGPFAETGLGRAVAGIGDWDGDGVPDIAASGWDMEDTDGDGVGDVPTGVVYVFSGADGSVIADVYEPNAGPWFGYGLFGLGDITGDGLADIAVVDRGYTHPNGATGRVLIFAGQADPISLTALDAHRVIVNDDILLRGFAAQIDTMHPDLWLAEPTLQIISLTKGESGGVNEAQSRIDIVMTDGQVTGTKGFEPTLVLAGDVNLDGRVDAQDLAESISQLGTDPQATGVMPIADMNEDGIVDALDIALLLESYGDETDIYTGLWDGSRLLAVVASSSGFGSVGTGPGGGSLGEGPGPSPWGNCERGDLPPDQGGPGILPALLRGDRSANCSVCPDCDEPDPGECYECDKAGTIVGGEITAVVQEPNPGQAAGQPLPGQTVCFEWEPFTVEGRMKKCKASCGDEGTECQVTMTVGDSWVIEKKDPDTGEWDEENPVKSSAQGDQPCITGAVCEEYRFVLTSTGVPEVDRCEELLPVEKVKEVQFVEFTLDWECVSEIPSNRRRSTIGIGESVKIWVAEPDAGQAEWEFTSNIEPLVNQNGRYIRITRPGVGKVSATINGCKRTIPFTAIAPSKLNYTKCPNIMFHTQGLIDLRYALWLDLDPDSVFFYAVEVREVPGPATNITGDFLLINPPSQLDHNNTGASWFPEADNVVRGGNADFAGLGPVLPGNGGFDWVIPIQVRVRQTDDDWIDIGTILQTFRLDDLCLTIAKDGNSHTACRDDPTYTQDWDNLQCPPD